jgi:dehydrogenase/reductase SDR family protein 4
MYSLHRLEYFFRIGLAIARRLAQEGAKVVTSSRDEANVTRAVQELASEGHSVHGVVCHVANPEHRKNLLKETVAKFGGIDILVSNAGVNPHVGSVMKVI